MNYARFIRVNRWALLIPCTFGILWLLPGIASAAPQAITMAPTSISPVINPGATYKGSFQVLNQGAAAYNFSVYSTPYHVSGEEYTPDFTVLPNAPKVSTWFTLSQTTGYIKPGQAITIHYTITMPADTLPGGYYAAVFAQTKPKESPGAVSLSERVGELFYIEAAGPVVRSGKLLTWQSSFLQQPPLTSTVRLQDSGSINYPSNIHITVRDILGRTKFSLNTTKELLPQTIRRITVPWQGSPPIGLFQVGGSVSFLGQTHVLPTRWVLVLSPLVRFIILAFVIVVVFVSLGRTSYRIRAHKRDAKPTKD